MINATYIWKFRNIDNAVAKWVNDDFARKNEKAFYAYFGYGGFGTSWIGKNDRQNLPRLQAKDDIMIMKLSLTDNESTLSYKINDLDEFIAHRNIERDYSLHYRMSLPVWTWKLVSIQLLDFKLNN